MTSEKVYTIHYLLGLEIQSEYDINKLNLPINIQSNIKMDKYWNPKVKSTYIIDLNKLFHDKIPSECEIIIDRKDVIQRIDQFKFVIREQTKEDYFNSNEFKRKAKSIKEVQLNSRQSTTIILSFKKNKFINQDSRTTVKTTDFTFYCELCNKPIIIKSWNYSKTVNEQLKEHLLNFHRY